MKLAIGLKIAALVLMALVAAFFAFMGLGEMFGGDLSGMIHLPPVALIILMMWFGWKKPLAGGASMMALGVVIAVFFYIVTTQAQKWIAILLMGGPFLLFGILFIAASLIGRPNHMRHI